MHDGINVHIDIVGEAASRGLEPGEFWMKPWNMCGRGRLGYSTGRLKAAIAVVFWLGLEGGRRSLPHHR